MFTREDLFSRDLTLHLSGRDERHFVPSGSASLQALLLRWFGHEPSIHAQPDQQDADDIAGDDDADEAVDRVERVVARRLSPEEERSRAKQAERDRHKARKIVEQMANLMASSGYLETRQLEDLGRDLKLAAVLLKLGSTKGWIEHEEVLATTHRVWTSLFLSAGDGDTEGWLRRRWEEDPLHAQQALARPAVTAALFVWGLEIQSKPKTPREVQMLLSLALSVARHPWLWLSADQTAVGQEVEAILAASSDEWSSDAIASRWLRLQALGRELGLLEDTVRRQGMSRLRALNLQQNLASGELVWQGALGYCVLKEPASREERNNVEVFLVQTGTTEEETKVLRSDLLNPVRGFAASDATSGGEEVQHLAEFLRSLSRGLERAS